MQNAQWFGNGESTGADGQGASCDHSQSAELRMCPALAVVSSPSPPLREERAGERRRVAKSDSPRPSPRSSLAGRGRDSANTLLRHTN